MGDDAKEFVHTTRTEPTGTGSAEVTCAVVVVGRRGVRVRIVSHNRPPEGPKDRATAVYASASHFVGGRWRKVLPKHRAGEGPLTPAATRDLVAKVARSVAAFLRETGGTHG